MEISRGEWEGKVRKEIYTPTVLKALKEESYTFRSPGGESHQDVENRMWNWLQQTAQQYEDQSLNIAVFSHGFAIRTLMMKLMGSDPQSAYRTVIHNTSINGIQLQGQDWLIERMNDHSHIAHTQIVGHYW